MEIVVESIRDPQGRPIPVRFKMGKKALDVTELLDQWHGSDYWYCKVMASDNCTYILKQNKDLKDWELTVFQENQSPEQPQEDFSKNI